MKTLIILGAGPKALAIAAKRAALKANGANVPDLVIIDRNAVGANWDGSHGYTDGVGQLGTSPEKDLGFPYPQAALFHTEESLLDSDILPRQVNTCEISRWMLANFSYQSFLIDTTGNGDYIDAGKPHPSHSEWASYLRWAWRRLQADSWNVGKPRTVLGEVKSEGISIQNNRWVVNATDDQGAVQTVEGDGLVITGPGEPKKLPGQDEAGPRVLDGKSVWSPEGQEILGRVKMSESIDVIGTGETTAAVLVLLQRFFNLRPDADARPHIRVLSPTGMLHSRGEGYWENSAFTHFREWVDLTVAQREAFIRRTDRGVLSPGALAQLTEARSRIQVLEGRIDRIVSGKKGKLDLYINHASEDREEAYPEILATDYVINCMGFDPWGFRAFLSETAIKHFNAEQLLLNFRLANELNPEEKKHEQHMIRSLLVAIREDLSFDIHPRLHLPMLAGIAQGAGMPNLSCLGHVADRILSAYVWDEKLRFWN